jgi:hypothetical protein
MLKSKEPPSQLEGESLDTGIRIRDYMLEVVSWGEAQGMVDQLSFSGLQMDASFITKVFWSGSSHGYASERSRNDMGCFFESS